MVLISIFLVNTGIGLMIGGVTSAINYGDSGTFVVGTAIGWLGALPLTNIQFQLLGLFWEISKKLTASPTLTFTAEAI